LAWLQYGGESFESFDNSIRRVSYKIKLFCDASLFPTLFFATFPTLFFAKMMVISDLALNPCRLNLIPPTSAQAFKTTPSNSIDV
jgi:hypothetical protein